MDKCRVLVIIGCRSDEGLSAPLLKRLENDEFPELIKEHKEEFMSYIKNETD